MDRTSNSVEYGILINQQNYDGYAIIAEIRQKVRGAIPKCGHVALVLDCCYVDVCVIFSSSGSLRMRLISQFSRASGARFSETDDSPETGSREMDLTGEIESASWIFNPFVASCSR